MATDTERALAARVAIETRWAREPDRKAATAAAREGRWRRYLEQVDEKTPGLPEPERQRRAAALRRADLARMSLKAAQARRARRGGAA